jgi:hypothetical protein
VAGVGEGAFGILTLWKSPILINEIGEGASDQTLHFLGETAQDSGKGHRTPSKKTFTSLGKLSTSSDRVLVTKDKKVRYFLPLFSLQISRLSIYGFILRFSKV